MSVKCTVSPFPPIVYTATCMVLTACVMLFSSHAFAEDLQPDRFTLAVLLIDAADFADARILAGCAVVIELAVGAFDLPAGDELVLHRRAL